MSYTEDGDHVCLEMTHEDFAELLLMLGYAAGAAHKESAGMSWRWIAFANKMNTGNPRFTPYEIPAEYARKEKS
jgi:hypothetical protein